ncbi:hypothetical protein BKA66DRAFT_577576 [Pyrenochaeta sp. MPI-SDFR-AT-0127]|nr:hypothetical protein BKA66DRAFT_577576 [Pyrenochaeta sp. MPI-SDFR-AT-0127]
MTKDDTTDARERKRSQNRAAQKTYRERMKRKIEDLEKWRDVALAMTSADNLGRVIPDSSDPSQHKSQSPVDIDFLDAEPCTASAPPRQLLSPISTPQVLQYGPGPSIADTVPQHPVTSGIDDILSLDWNNFRTSETIPAYEAGLPSQPKKVVWDMFSPSQSSLHATRQRSKSIVSVEDFGDGSLRKAAYEPWSQNETLAVCIL